MTKTPTPPSPAQRRLTTDEAKAYAVFVQHGLWLGSHLARCYLDLLDLLQSMEWVRPVYNGSPSCPDCGNQQHMGHAEGCELAAVLGRA